MREPTTRLIDSTDGVEVAAHDYGGGGPHVFFVHGTGMVSRMWEPVMELLDDRVHPVGIDLRGHGASQFPADVSCDDFRMVADVCAVLDDFEARGSFIVGHSMGGGTALLSSLARPGALAAAWVFEPIIFERPVERPTDIAEMTRKRRAEFPSRAEVVERFASRPPFDEMHPACLAAYVDHGFTDQPDESIRLACDPEIEARVFEDYLHDGWDRLPDIAIPVRVARGTDESLLSSTEAPGIARRLPAGELEDFEGASHMGCFGDLDRVAHSIRETFALD